LDEACTSSCKILHVWHVYCIHFSQLEQFRRFARLIAEGVRMYLLFIPPVLAFVGIFAITLRNQFADYTNL